MLAWAIPLLKFGKSHLLEIVVALAVGFAVWHYMDLRSDRDRALEQVAQSNRLLAEQNAKIKDLAVRYNGMKKDIAVVSSDADKDRSRLDTKLLVVKERVEVLKTQPSASTETQQCKDATEELRNVSEVLDLLNSDR